MKRSALVAAGTAVGVTAVVSYHAATPSAGAASASAPTSSSLSTARTAARTTGGATSTGSTSSQASTTTTTSSSRGSGSRSAVGEAVSFQYGELQVKVSERDGKITNVSLVRFDIGDPRSQSIDEYAVPRLRQEVLSAQSAHIDGVSGASYTSQAYEQSVQSALDRLA